MGLISINGLRMRGYHGVLSQERKVGNTFEITLTLEVPQSEQAMSSDNLEDTVNYADIADLIKIEMSKPQKLIEAVAGNIINAIKQKFGNKVTAGKISISKLAPPIPYELDSVSYTAIF